MLENETDPPIQKLIDLQRRLTRSKNLFLRRVGALLAAGALDRWLSEFDDQRIADLLRDEVERDLGIATAESTICRQATARLLRSGGGTLVPDPLSGDGSKNDDRD